MVLSGVNPGDLGQPGGDAGGATAGAGSTDPINTATAIGGNGGRGGTDGFDWNDFHGGDGPSGAKGGRGGDASAGATTTIISGPAEADATSSGGSGGYGGGVDEAPDQGGGDGGFATGTAAASSGTGSAKASAIANGGSGGGSDLLELEPWAATPAPAARPQLRVLATHRPLRTPLAVRPDIVSFLPVFFLPRQRHCDSRCVGDRRREGDCHGGRGGGFSRQL